MVVADDMVPIWHQGICSHHDDVGRSAYSHSSTHGTPTNEPICIDIVCGTMSTPDIINVIAQHTVSPCYQRCLHVPMRLVARGSGHVCQLIYCLHLILNLLMSNMLNLGPWPVCKSRDYVRVLEKCVSSFINSGKLTSFQPSLMYMAFCCLLYNCLVTRRTALIERCAMIMPNSNLCNKICTRFLLFLCWNIHTILLWWNMHTVYCDKICTRFSFFSVHGDAESGNFFTLVFFKIDLEELWQSYDCPSALFNNPDSYRL